MMKPKIERLGEFFTNKYGEIYIIIDYKNASSITVRFENGYVRKNCHYNTIVKGELTNPYTPTIYGKGFFGEGKYNSLDANKETSKCYRTWAQMFIRCYTSKYQKNKPSYMGCSVCKEWGNYQNFAKWYEENYYVLTSDELMCLDKDILIKGNKIYGPNTCCFVDKKINSLFTNCKRKRGNYPIGVIYKNNKYYARLSEHESSYKIRKNLGYFNTPEEAFMCYKKAKENYIKKIADEYKLKYTNFPKNLYDALYDYNIEITD